MKLIKRLIESKLWAIWIAYGAFLFLTSFPTNENASKSSETVQASSYTPREEKPLTSEISGQIERAEDSIQPVDEKSVHYKYTEDEIDMLARLVLREAGGCSKEEQRLIVWTVFQRVDSTDHDFRNMNTIGDVVTAPYQFAYDEAAPVKDDIRQMCEAELEKWAKGGAPPVVEPYAPSLPYLFFEGDGRHNWFRAEW